MAKSKEILLYDEPPKKKTKKVKKEKKRLKQKQKQNVKQNVEVKVQSSGGAGSSPGVIPSQFQDRTGENIRIQNLIDTLQKQAKREAIQPPSIRSNLFSEVKSGVSIPVKANRNTDSLYDRVSNNNNRVDEAVDAMQYADAQAEDAILSGDIDTAIRLNKKVDDLDDKINNLHDESREDVENVSGEFEEGYSPPISSPRGRKQGSKNLTPSEKALRANEEIKRAYEQLLKQQEKELRNKEIKMMGQEESLTEKVNKQEAKAQEKALKAREKVLKTEEKALIAQKEKEVRDTMPPKKRGPKPSGGGSKSSVSDI